MISADPDIWRTDDEDWLRTRLQNWKIIQQRLPSLKRIVHRKSWKYLKALFLYGAPVPEYHISGIWSNDCKLFEIWFNPICPVAGEIVYEDHVGSIVDLRIRFRKMFRDIYVGLAPEGDSCYGAMGGREQLIMLDLNRGADPSVQVDFGSGVLYPSCSDPILPVIERCFIDTILELRSYEHEPLDSESFDTYHIANLPGLVAWDLVSDMMEKNPNWVDHSIRSAREPLVYETMEAVLKYWDYSVNDKARLRTETAQFAEDLHRKFENRVFCESLMGYWDRTRRKFRNRGSRFI